MEIAKPSVGAIKDVRDAFIAHTDELVSDFEDAWRVSRNPFFVWVALGLLLDTGRPPQILPDWLRDNLREVASNLIGVFATPDSIRHQG